MNKKGFSKMVVFLCILVVVGIIFISYLLFNALHSSKSTSSQGVDLNPVGNLSIEQATAIFNESFVSYFLYSINVDKLHNPPLSSDTPKINFFIDNDVYNAEVKSGVIKVGKGNVDGEDIIIKTTKVEAVKMIKDKSYVSNSFVNGSSEIELVASKAKLYSKGYLSLYGDITGQKE